jgi:cytochrome c oxidase cbb3-type subunit III
VRGTRIASPWLLAGATLLAGCDSLPGRPKLEDREVRPDQVEDFRVLYAENCAGCHGTDGKGNAALGLANPVYLAMVDDATLGRVITDGVRGTQMSAFARSAGGMLTDRQVAVLVKGIRGWAQPQALAGTVPPPYAATPGDAARGAGAYATYCSSCHGAEGKGGPKGGSIVDGSYLGLVSDQGLRTTVIAGRPEIGQPDWRNDVPGRAMTAAEVADVVAWLTSQRAEAPGRPYPSH